jgi:hypothetical protein
MPPKKNQPILKEPVEVTSQVNLLRKEYEQNWNLLNVQPQIVQRFIQQQAHQISEALLQHSAHLRFSLPDRITVMDDGGKTGASLTIPLEYREQMAGGVIDRLTRTDARAALVQRLAELEQNENPAIAQSGKLIRFAVAYYMVHNMLPEGRDVRYIAAEGEEIPSIPFVEAREVKSAITATTDAITEEGLIEAGRGELLVPYAPAARHFYLPQWVAFDDSNQLLVGTLAEAEAHVASTQRFVSILHQAVGLAPFMVADEVYQRKRFGILGQLVNQGRALANYQVGEIISTIQQRARVSDLNRGLSLSLPYFDDQDLIIRNHDFEVIPAGRIMFVPAFVVRAAEMEQAKVAQDTRLSPSTRRHLLSLLKMLERAFQNWANKS